MEIEGGGGGNEQGGGTYKAPRIKTPIKAAFWFRPICRLRITGMGRRKTKISNAVFQAAWAYQKGGALKQ